MASKTIKRTTKAPISAHPAFGMVVALWFAALLGLGSIILPAALIERAVTASGLAEILPAAAPPLGVKARAVIGLICALLGAALGLLAARKLVRPAMGEPRRRSAKGEDTVRRAPLSPRAELGSDSFDSVADFSAARRRALTGAEDAGPSEYLVPSFAYAAAAEPLELEECAEFTEVQDEDAHDAPAEDEVAMNQQQEFSPIEPESEPLNFSPPSMARRYTVEELAGEPEVAEFEAAEGAEEPEAPHALDSVMARAEPAPAEPDLVDLVQQLSATLERHRAWSAQNAGWRMNEPQAVPQFPRVVAATPFDEAEPAEAAQAMAAFFSAPEAVVEAVEAEPEQAERQEFIPIPAAETSADAHQLCPFAGLEPVTDGDDDDVEDDGDESAAPLSLPLGGQSEAAEPDESFGSLLQMKNPFRDHRPEFVRVDEPEPEAAAPQPAVVFPHEAPGARAFDRPAVAPVAVTAPVATPVASNEDNDRVLREALMNLQRIGKN